LPPSGASEGLSGYCNTQGFWGKSPLFVLYSAEKFDAIRPANTTIIYQFPVPDAKVEIEITARKQNEMGA
jgi:hypothetical protein